ncbi:bifunctional (p)ppGpp synthetase/guanosine-3',5'-bis(diphosphate) 3'-pyrophosphohydrolase [Haloferula sp. BvORR071]|uniref:bifunctional (p)ppGpp synthetase/guanosine-3',5'-bis(diphosphate) 3'-pyrophosphohydrolase n=1 Tax=Haloferula sp. BvORR071 TaxID=1396141 RepID=UPI000695C6BC|nr:bifunctional (p)ppGpp synthetase/guanosine-3',5'-bis(diphosphate) 3'-pyrophosphohydrolase [Haloferula sp. BvORR071]
MKRASAIALEAHAGQFRRDGTTPYVRHPEAVAARVAGDPLAEAVAWLHDVLEDTAVTPEMLRSEGIPEEVIAAVAMLTKPDGADYEEYLRAIKANPLAKKVKLADMLSNLGDQPSEKQILKYAKGLTILLT